MDELLLHLNEIMKEYLLPRILLDNTSTNEFLQFFLFFAGYKDLLKILYRNDKMYLLQHVLTRYSKLFIQEPFYRVAIGYNCGTGVCCNGIDVDGNRMMLAGLGDFSGDISGGGNIVIKAFELVYNELFLGLEKTLITPMVMEKYGFKDRGEVLGLIEKIEGEDGAEHIRNMVAFFFEAAKQGDKPARDYCEKMAIRGAQLISALSNELDFGDGEVEVVLSGSINVKLDNKFYLDMLLSKAEEFSGKKLKFIKLDALPVTGCINWIMQDYAG